MSVPPFSEDRVRSLLSSFRGKRVAVVGDLMIDRYYWGTVTRVSPEAPVPVVEVESESVRLGGAANVAHNIKALGGVPLIIGLVGDDFPGTQLRELMVEGGFDTAGIVADPDRQTTIKTRVIAHDQHVVRIDNETKTPCPAHLASRVVDVVKNTINALDAVLVEDYNKGALSREVIRQLLGVVSKHGRIVTVDPKFDNFFEFRGVTVFKPNRREAEEVLGGRLRKRDDIERAGAALLDRLEAENVLLTRGEEGMSLFERDGSITHLASVAENVRDVSGAGDTVISTLTMALAAGVSAREASMLANCAGGVVVGSVGIVPIDVEKLVAAAIHSIDHEGNRH